MVMTLGDLKAAIQLAEELGANDKTPINVHAVIEENYATTVADGDNVETEYIKSVTYNNENYGDTFWIKFNCQDDKDMSKSHVIAKVASILGDEL